jgi:NADPH:quinone reductase-like Zn-dependent oxidoreductase
MKALVIQDGFGLDHLAVVDRPDPSPGPGQVVVRVRAASLNYRDLLIARGAYNPRLPLPRVLGSDGAGEVAAVGPGVTRWAAGDKVVGCFFQGWAGGPITEAATKTALGGDRDGMLAELALLDEDGLVPLPGTLSFEEAATLPCAAVTAWNALTAGGCGPGKTVLLQGTGGVSVFALQLAKALGARVLVTSGSDAKLARALELGADAGTNYKSAPDWDKWAKAQTGGEGVDLVVEVGGAGTLERSARAARMGGFVALIGVLSGAGAFNPMAILMRSITLKGIYVGSRALFEDLNRLVVGEGVKPVIDRVFPLAEAAAAIRYLETGSHFGKVVVAVG